MQKTFIISLGGSLIVNQKGINYKYLKEFRASILKFTKKGYKFFIVTGGGETARDYIDAADKIIKTKDHDRDWLGIHSTRLNAHLVKTIFAKIAQPNIIKNPTYRHPMNHKVVIAGGWKPGWSTDYVATLIAQEYEIKTIINLSNIDYAYDKDPKKFKTAKKIKETTWKDFRKIVGYKWSPGLNSPFDPIASGKADALNMKVCIMGNNIKNLENFILDKKYRGTLIANK